MRPFQRTLLILVTVVLAGVVGYGIAEMSAGPSLGESSTIIIPESALTPTAAPRPAAGSSAAPQPESTVVPVVQGQIGSAPDAASAEPSPAPSEPSPAPTPAVFLIRELTNLRGEANPDGPILWVLNAGDEVLILGETQTAPDGGVWVKVRFAEQEGWLNSRLMR
jgi:hypothetical protein